MVATCSITGGQVGEPLSQEAVETALGQAFSDAPVERPAKESARPPEADEPEAPVEAADEGEPADEVEDVEGDEPADEVAEVVAAEPEFEIEVDGAVEVVRGKDAIKELLQKGRDYSRKSEANARIRDALAAQAMQTKMAQEFQGAVFEDVAQLRALDQQIQQYAQIDWATAFDSDPFNALKLKEQGSRYLYTLLTVWFEYLLVRHDTYRTDSGIFEPWQPPQPEELEPIPSSEK